MQARASVAELVAFPSRGFGLGASLMAHLKRHRLPESLIQALVREARLEAKAPLVDALTRVLAARMRPASLDFARAPRLFLIGPPGAGVFSVAAKLRHAASLAEQGTIVEKSLFDPRNMRARAAFRALGSRADGQTIGVISALSDAEEVSDIMAQFGIERVIVTGLDLASRFGALTAAATQGAHLVGVTSSPEANAPLETIAPETLADLLLN